MCCCNGPDRTVFEFEMEDGSEVPRHSYQCRDFQIVDTRVSIHSFYYEGSDVVTFVLRKKDDA